ncbi:MAG: triose-phosphate isomerase [Bacteroidota bacterium]
MRKKIVAGNWKMNCTLDDAKKLTSEVLHMHEDEISNEAQVIIVPPALFVSSVKELIGSNAPFQVGAQNCHQESKGAYTGEISAEMIKSCGGSHVILGHSERREYFAEEDALIAKKIKKTLENGLIPIYCCGEKLAAREESQEESVVLAQIREALFSLSPEEIPSVVIAYEPVWAIGTGKTATSVQAQQMHAFIRSQLADKFGAEIADEISILYGGSVKPENAKEIFSQKDVDGGLIGGASLKSRDFIEIVKACD